MSGANLGVRRFTLSCEGSLEGLACPVYPELRREPRRAAAFLPRALIDAPTPNPFKINTYKTVSKQTTSSPFRMNTYKKHTGGGGLMVNQKSLGSFWLHLGRLILMAASTNAAERLRLEPVLAVLRPASRGSPVLRTRLAGFRRGPGER